MKKVALLIFSAAVLLALNGCLIPQAGSDRPTVTVVKAAAGEIIFDGKLSEKFWQQVPSFELVRCDASGTLPPLERDRIIADGLEKCTVKLAYDDKYFYMAAMLEDNDIISMCQNTAPAFSGDTMGFSLFPEDALYQWTFYAAPNKAKAAFFLETPTLDHRMKLKGNYGRLPGFESVCSLDGSLNKQNDKDKGWSVEMRIPLKEISRRGINFAPGEKWRLLALRFNYSAYNYAVQTSCYPALPAYNFGLKSYFARVIFR